MLKKEFEELNSNRLQIQIDKLSEDIKILL